MGAGLKVNKVSSRSEDRAIGSVQELGIAGMIQHEFHTNQMATITTSFGSAVLAKRTNNPATIQQRRIVGKLINLLLQHEVYASLEDAQSEFIILTGYKSIIEMSTWHARQLIQLYASMLKNQIEAKKAEREFFRSLC